MATPSSAKHRCAFGPRDANIFTPHSTAKRYGIDAHADTVRKGYSGLPSKRSVEPASEGHLTKVARYFEVSDKRVGVEHWLENGVAGRSPSCPPGDVTGAGGQFVMHEDAHLPYGSERLPIGLGEPHFGEIGRERYGELKLPQGRSRTLQRVGGNEPSISCSFTTAAAATTLRLRLRVALFKVQTNQTAIPISHLQLPESSPQPLSVFPPSLVRVSTPRGPDIELYNNYDYDDDGIEPTASPPPSSPPPLAETATRCAGKGIPFLTPIRSSSPSPNHGRPLDFGSSSDSQGHSSRDSTPGAI